jgi:hypothetical protein
MTTPTKPHLWRAQAKLVARGQSAALIEIPAIEGGRRYPVSWSVVPEGTELGDRFYVRCTLDRDHFAVEPDAR